MPKLPLLPLSLLLACSAQPEDKLAETTSTSEAATATAPLTTTAADPATTTTGELPDTTTGEPATTTTASTGPAACEPNITDECDTCMQGACCDDLAACQNDPQCVACVTGEDGTQCEENAATHERVQRYLECRGGPCQDTCIAAEGKTCEEALAVFTPDDCTECLAANCCDGVAACSTNAICWDGCFTNHSPDKCHSDPDGHALYHALAVCINASCATPCSG